MTIAPSISCIGIDDAETDAVAQFIDGCRDAVAQQTPAWARTVAPIGPDPARFLDCREGARIVGVLPAYCFDGPLGSILTSATGPGTLGGMACAEDTDKSAVYHSLLSAFLDLARDEDCAVATVLSDPFNDDAQLCAEFLGPHFTLKNRCQVLDLGAAFDAAGGFASLSENVRRNLKKAEASDLFIDEDQTPGNVEAWHAIHAERHQEIGATPLPKSFFLAALEHMVPRDKARYFFIRHRADANRLIAGGFYVYHGRVIDALMPSLRSESAELRPNYLLAAHTIRWARARGLEWYNWQASPPGSGVERFKRQWGSVDRHYYFYTRITGDVSRFTSQAIDVLRSAYRWHYVMPFDCLGKTPDSAGPIASSRDRAWSAQEATR